MPASQGRIRPNAGSRRFSRSCVRSFAYGASVKGGLQPERRDNEQFYPTELISEEWADHQPDRAGDGADPYEPKSVVRVLAHFAQNVDAAVCNICPRQAPPLR